MSYCDLNDGENTIVGLIIVLLPKITGFGFSHQLHRQKQHNECVNRQNNRQDNAPTILNGYSKWEP